MNKDKKIIYLDHAASTPTFPEVLSQFIQDAQLDYANPSSSHLLGKEINEKLKSLSMKSIELLGGDQKDEFYFTSSATESNNTIIKGFQYSSDDYIIYTPSDHPSLVAPIEAQKCKKILIPLNSDATINFENLELILREHKDINLIIATTSFVNNQSGVINKIDFFSKLVKRYFPKTHIHIDAVQGFNKIPLYLNQEIDSLAISGHKIGGLKGVGGLFLKKNHKVSPLLIGGGQQNGFRSSTENFSLANSLVNASLIGIEFKNADHVNRVQSLHDLIRVTLEKNISQIIFPFKETSPYILTFIIPGLPSDVLLRHLEQKGIFLSSTSACSSKIKGFNPTLSALKINEKYHKNIIRLSLGFHTNIQEVESFLQEFLIVWNELKFLIR